LDDAVKLRVRTILGTITSNTPPLPTPSAGECGYCAITVGDCSSRIDAQPEDQQKELGEF
jgi:hypothetical protein